MVDRTEDESTPFYRVENAGDPSECGHCHQACDMWTIVFEHEGEPTEIGSAWGDKEMVEAICDLMNMAFDAGRETNDHAD